MRSLPNIMVPLKLRKFFAHRIFKTVGEEIAKGHKYDTLHRKLFLTIDVILTAFNLITNIHVILQDINKIKTKSYLNNFPIAKEKLILS